MINTESFYIFRHQRVLFINRLQHVLYTHFNSWDPWETIFLCQQLGPSSRYSEAHRVNQRAGSPRSDQTSLVIRDRRLGPTRWFRKSECQGDRPGWTTPHLWAHPDTPTGWSSYSLIWLAAILGMRNPFGGLGGMWWDTPKVGGDQRTRILHPKRSSSQSSTLFIRNG